MESLGSKKLLLKVPGGGEGCDVLRLSCREQTWPSQPSL